MSVLSVESQGHFAIDSTMIIIIELKRERFNLHNPTLRAPETVVHEAVVNSLFKVRHEMHDYVLSTCHHQAAVSTWPVIPRTLPNVQNQYSA